MNLFSDHDRQTLIKMIQVMYPHDSFPRGPYERTAQAVLDAVAGDPHRQAKLRQGLNDMDTLRPDSFIDLDDGAALTILRGIQDAPFFVDLLGVAGVAFYDDHEVWDLLGYEGPSFDEGGYLERGFNDLSWLPEPKIEEETA